MTIARRQFGGPLDNMPELRKFFKNMPRAPRTAKAAWVPG